MDPLPRYVVFTNRRELQLYDTKDAPRSETILSIDIEDLPKYSEALAFLTHDWKTTDVLGDTNVQNVSKNVANMVGAFYQSLIVDGIEQDNAVRFTLQCITAMFAEDIGLLPPESFTLRLYEAQAKGNVVENLGDLFGQMSTPTEGYREIRYFNGGLFQKPAVIELKDDQLRALTKAAEANWMNVIRLGLTIQQRMISCWLLAPR